MIDILMIEDDKVLAEGVQMALEQDGYHVELAAGLSEGMRRLAGKPYQLLILDRSLPDGDGLAFCRRQRQTLSMPILFLTARDTEDDEIAGLEAGAEDYITKPFRIGVLRARVKALLRRTPEMQRYHAGELTFDFEKRRYLRDGVDLELSRAEQELLRILVSHPDQTYTRDYLITHIWDFEDSVDENTLTVTVARLRGKIGGKWIRTVYGIGYRWTENM
ncbi:MAG: response regulator transcription factor [Lachnospiraceae bacterium]|nr:response regulator transcription factor [Lachnospiraceae bacterium]